MKEIMKKIIVDAISRGYDMYVDPRNGEIGIQGELHLEPVADGYSMSAAESYWWAKGYPTFSLDEVNELAEEDGEIVFSKSELEQLGLDMSNIRILHLSPKGDRRRK